MKFKNRKKLKNNSNSYKITQQKLIKLCKNPTEEKKNNEISYKKLFIINLFFIQFIKFL